MKKLTKYILFVSLGGLFAVNIFNSLINTEKINLFFGGTVNNNIIHIHSTDYTSPVAVPRASNDIPPVITQTAPRDSIPAVIPQVSEDTHKAETLSKDSRPQTNTHRPELIYQFISRYSGLISAGENDKSAKVSEDAKTVTPDTQPVAPQKVSQDTPAIKDTHTFTLDDSRAVNGTVNNNIIHIHSTDYTSPVAVPRASNDIPPVITQTAPRDSIPAVIPQVSEDTHKAETLSKDSRPQTNTHRPELIYQFISRYSGLISAGENDKSAKVSEDAKTVTPDIQPAKPQKVSHDTPAINVSADEPATPQSPDIPAETPRNDSAPKAITFTSWLKTRSSKNTHTFTLDDSCTVNVSFTPSEGDKAYYVLTVTGDFGHVITRKMIDSENLHTGTGNIYLRPGNYTVSIERGYSWSGKPYRITVSTSQITNTEHESNNSPQTANVIPLNENVSASSGTRNDTDYYTFTLEKPMMIRPCLEFHEVRNGRRVYDKKLYGLTVDDRDFIFRGDATPSRKIKSFALDAGTYIISVSRLEPEELELGLHEYTLRVEAQELM